MYCLHCNYAHHVISLLPKHHIELYIDVDVWVYVCGYLQPAYAKEVWTHPDKKLAETPL